MKISGIKLKLNENEEKLYELAKKKSGINGKYFRILKKSLDARDKRDIFYVYSVEISDEPFKEEDENVKEYNYPKTVVIIGFGPAGMFCGLRLARAGFKPIIIERGEDVDNRKKSKENFYKNKILNTESNVQFGEGGAGTFSDGKLNTGVNGIYRNYILENFVKFGAPKEITYQGKPHIGSDILPTVVKNLREEIISHNGRVLFNTRLSDVEIKNGRVSSITVENGGKKEIIEVDEVVLAIGHSSRDTYKMLYKKGVIMEQKDCAIGFRIEHSQHEINLSQFGKEIGVSADYKLTSNKGERGVFSFCMCPGGSVENATSVENAVCTNGMSEYKRDKENANSAIICQIKSSDYGSGVLDGIDFLENIEKRAFTLGGSNYQLPCQNVTDFLSDKLSTKFYNVIPSVKTGTNFVKMDSLLPKYVCDNIRIGLSDFENKIHGFSKFGVITAPETRTSSPVRIKRDENYNAIGIENLYPVGEVGYAGGIMSSGMDGVKIAEKIKEKYLRG